MITLLKMQIRSARIETPKDKPQRLRITASQIDANGEQEFYIDLPLQYACKLPVGQDLIIAIEEDV